MNYHPASAAVFPTVATVIGFTPDSQGGPLVATLACPPAVIADMSSEQISTVTTLVHPNMSSSSANIDQSQKVAGTTPGHNIDTSDPVTKAVVDNIVGNLPTKKPQTKLSCDVCNIQVLGQNIMEEHLAGAKHARKVKSLELMKEMKSMISNSNSTCLDLKNNSYTCKPCNVIVNSIQQLQVHCQGSKHKSKVTSENGSISNGEIQKDIIKLSEFLTSTTSEEKGDAMSSRFYCSACNVKVNSDTQLEQHRMSKKHSGRVSGGNDQSNRAAPYFKNQRKVFVREGWTGNPNPGQYQSTGGGGSLRCNVCGVNANSALQLQQHNYSKKHKDKLTQKVSEPMETNQHPPLMSATPFIKKQWMTPQNDVGGPYSYGGHGGHGGGGGSYNVYPKWSAPTFQRSQPGGYNRY